MALFQHGRELGALVSDKHRNQFGRLGIARIGRNQMCRARRLEKRLTDAKCFDLASPKLGPDLALRDVGGHRARMTMRAAKTSGAIEHPHDCHPFAGHVRQRVRGDYLDLVER